MHYVFLCQSRELRYCVASHIQFQHHGLAPTGVESLALWSIWASQAAMQGV